MILTKKLRMKGQKNKNDKRMIKQKKLKYLKNRKILIINNLKESKYLIILIFLKIPIPSKIQIQVKFLQIYNLKIKVKRKILLK